MASLTSCIKKAGDALRPEDKAAVLARFNALVGDGAKAGEAAAKAVDERIAEVQALIAGLGGKAGPAAPLYASRPVVNAQAIIDWAASQGFKTTLPATDMHVTVAYSRDAMDGKAVPAGAPGVSVLGGKRTVEPLGEEGAVVLKFTSAEMSNRWQAYRDAGASWDYDSYTPHITITYDGSGVDLSKVKPYTGPIELGAETQEPLNVDKADDYKESEVKPGSAAEKAATGARLTDAGEELIRNRRGKLKGLAWDDVSAMNDTLKVAQVVKANVWPRPDYAKMVEDGAPAWKAAALKAVYDKLAAAPVTRTAPTDADLKAYIETLHQVRDALMAELDRVAALPGGAADLWKTLSARNVFGKVFPIPADAKPVYGSPSPFDRVSEQGKANNKRALMIGGNNAVQALQFGHRTLSKIKDLLADGFPAKQEAWQKSWEVRQTDTRDSDVPEAERTGQPQQRFYVYEKGSRWRLAKGGQDGGYATQEQAEAFARSLTAKPKKDVLPPSRGLDLSDVKRTGPDWRAGKDVTAQDIMDRFGFRGVNLGEYVKAKQGVAQLHLNHVFDAFSDLADLLGVPPKAMSLNGTLGVAVGAQGSGKALAHFVPGVNEINITRDSGAGALAHEFGHATDHYFATQHGRAASMAKRPYLSAVVENINDAGGVRPEVMDAMRAVMKTLNSRPMTEAEARKYLTDQRELNQRRLALWVKEFSGNKGADPAALAAVAEKLKRGDLGEAQDTDVEVNLAEFMRAAGLKPGNAIAGNAFALAYRLRDLADEARFLASHIPQVDTDYAKASAAMDAKKQAGKAYWSTPWEKFARAFETFAMDALRDRQRESLYLSGLVDSEGWASWAAETGKAIPYPAGAERLEMQQAFQRLVDTIQTRTDDAGNVALFSRTMGQQSPALQALADNDDLFAIRRLEGSTVSEIAFDLDPAIKVTPLPADKGRERWRVTLEGGAYGDISIRKPSRFGPNVYGFDINKDGETVNVVTERPGSNPDAVDPSTEDVWIDVSGMKTGQGGAQVYAIAGALAHNTGRIFIGDPNGLSDIALRRRAENMLSLALRYGTTDFLAPHPDQTKGNAEQGVPPLRWVYGDDEGNAERLIALNVTAVENAFPDIAKIDFDATTGDFLNAVSGARIDRDRLAGRAIERRKEEGGDGALGRAAAAGRTVARAAVLRALSRPEGGGSEGRGQGRNGVLDRLGAAAGGAAGRSLTGLFKRADEAQPAEQGRQVEVARVTATAKAVREAWAVKPDLVVFFGLQDPKLPPSVRDYDNQQRSQGAVGDIDGFYWQGRIYVNAAALQTDADVVRVMYHEGLGHAGLRGHFGPELDSVLDRMSRLYNQQTLQDKAIAYGLANRDSEGRFVSYKDEKARLTAAEEVLAEIAQSRPSSMWVKRAIAAIRTWLRENLPGVFGKMALSDAEIIRSFIAPARGFIERGRAAERADALPAFSRSEPDSGIIRVVPIPTGNGTMYAVTRNVYGQGSQHLGYFDTEQAANEAAGQERTSARRAAGKGARWWVENPAEPIRSAGGSRLDSLGRSQALKATLDARGSSVKTRAEGLPLKQLPERAGFCYKLAAEASAAGLGDMVIGKADNDGSPEWHAVVQRDGAIYDPTFGRWFEPGVYEALGFDAHTSLTPEAVRDFIARSGGMAPDAKSLKLDDAPPLFSRTPQDKADRTADKTANAEKKALAAALLDGSKRLPLHAGYVVGDMIGKSAGRLHWWHKGPGTPMNLALRQPQFKPVYDALQDFIGDISHYASEAQRLAPRLLPRMDGIRDLAKGPISATDAKAVAAPVFEGTLGWIRTAEGDPIKVDEAERQAAGMSADEKAQELLRSNLLNPRVLKMWQGLPLEQYEAAIETRYANQVLRPGVVWSDAELRSMFKLTGPQIDLYKEFRTATDRSLDDLTVSAMLRVGGEDVSDIRQQVLDLNLNDAAEMIRDRMFDLAEQQPDQADKFNTAGNSVIDMADRVQDLKERGYAPLMRFGGLTLDVVTPDGERQYFGLFETDRERSRKEREMRANFPDATIDKGTVSRREFELFAGVTPETLELFADKLGIPKEVQEGEVYQKWLQFAKSNRSGLKRLIHRKGVPGFNEDVGRVLAAFIYSNARQTSGNLHAGQAENAMAAIDQRSGELKDYAKGLIDSVRNPTEQAQGLKAMMFTQFLGGSFASAMVNMTQPFTVTGPYLAQYGGEAKAAKQMAAALKDVGRRIFPNDPGLTKALRLAEEDGTVMPQEIFSLQAQASGRAQLMSGDGTVLGTAGKLANNGWARLNLLWGRPFAWAEMFNRRLTYIAAYRTAVEQGMPDPAAFAKETVNVSQIVYNAGNRPAWARSYAGAVLMTFKQFATSMIELLARSMKTPQGRRTALAMLLMLVVVSGLDGLPFREDIEDVIDGFAQRVLDQNFSAKAWRNRAIVEGLLSGMAAFGVTDPKWAEGIAQGLQNGLTGIPGMPFDVSGRLGLHNLIPGTGLLLKKEDHTRDVAELAGPAGSFGARLYEAAGQALSGSPGKALLTASPLGVQNAAKGLEMAKTGRYPDTRDNMVVRTSLADAVSKGIGFQPQGVKKVQDVTFEQARLKGLAVQVEREIVDAMAKGLVREDDAMLDAAIQRLEDWNLKNPETEIKITVKQVRSRVENMTTEKTTRMLKTTPRELRPGLADAFRKLEPAGADE